MMSMIQERLPLGWLGLFLVGLLLVGGCNRAPRSREEIHKERDELPTLYLTDKTQQRVIAPASKGLFVDPKTKEICWRAQQCNNPDCPGRKNNEPFLFTISDPGAFVQEDGTIGFDVEKSKNDPGIPGCPACYKIRKLDQETPSEQGRYISFVQLYELPEAVARRKQLDEEYKRTVEFENSQK
jgi:hypothetical protein